MTLSQPKPDVPDVDALVAAHGELSAMAGILSKVQTLLRRDDTTTSDVAELLKLDPGIAQRLVRVSNSVFFRRGVSCHSLEDALIRIGFAEIKEVVSLVVGSAMFARPLHAYGRSAMKVWHEAAGVAVCASTIAEDLGEDSDISYTAGLFHTAGRPVIDKYLSKAKPDLFLEDAGFPVKFAEAERMVLGYSQASVAAVLMGQMQFPALLVDAVRQQDDSLTDQEGNTRLRWILAAARMTYEAEYGEGKRGTPPCAEVVLNQLGMNSGRLRDLVPAFKESLERAIQISYC